MKKTYSNYLCKRWKQLMLLILFLHASAESKSQTANPFDVVIMEPADTHGSVAKHEKLELGIKLNPLINGQIMSFLNGNAGLNPFDPEDVSIEMTLQSPGEINKTAYGFYYRDYIRKNDNSDWIDQNTEYPWRIRVTLDEPGVWHYKIKVFTNNVLSGEISSGSSFFNCMPSGSKGYVYGGDRNFLRGRYLKFSETGGTFFPIGENLCWNKSGHYVGGAPNELQADDHLEYFQWMNELSANGGNLVRIGMLPWSFGLEWEKLGNYNSRMANAWELDQLFNKAEDLGIYINLWLEDHLEFMITPGGGEGYPWSGNPYNINITGVNVPKDYFTDAKAKKFYKNKLRYIASRWGYSTNLVSYELVSEIDMIFGKENNGFIYHQNNSSGRELRLAVRNWFNEMGSYLKSVSNASHPPLVSGSFASGEDKHIAKNIFSLEAVDFSIIHDYGSAKSVNYIGRYKIADNLLNPPWGSSSNASVKNKPLIFGEIGSDWPGIDLCSDVSFHNAIWATAMMGSFGSGWPWFWEDIIHPNQYYTNYLALNTFMQGVELAHDDYKPQRWRNGNIDFNCEFFPKNINYTIENFALVNSEKTKALGWMHSATDYWANLGLNCRCYNEATKTYFDCKFPCDEDAHPYPAVGLNSKVKITGLKSLKKYQYQWYHIPHNGKATLHSAGFESTNIFGTLKLNVGIMLQTAPDYAYKIFEEGTSFQASGNAVEWSDKLKCPDNIYLDNSGKDTKGYR